MATTYDTSAPAAAPDTRWRTRDIVVAAVIGVAFGVVFVAAGGIWNALAPSWPFRSRTSPYAVWLLPAVVAPLTIRKPGAALFAEVVAAGLSAFLGSTVGRRHPHVGGCPGSGRRARVRVHPVPLGRSRSWLGRGRGRVRPRRSSTTALLLEVDHAIQVLVTCSSMTISAVVLPLAVDRARTERSGRPASSTGSRT